MSDPTPGLAMVQVLADHGPALRIGRSECICGAVIHDDGQFRTHVAAALAAAGFGDVSAAREADRAEVERLRGLADTYLEEHDKQHTRAEAAEERLAEVVARVEALADEWERTCSDRVGGRWTCKPGSRCQSCTEAVTLAARLRALLTTDDTTALDAVREQARAEERERIARAIEAEAKRRDTTGKTYADESQAHLRTGFVNGLDHAARIAREAGQS